MKHRHRATVLNANNIATIPAMLTTARAKKAAVNQGPLVLPTSPAILNNA
ncbi:MAG: hypothetical protein WC711_00245 [Candidatus Staskawiczbacteria bacterium]|jgi:hypothetical protein